MSHIREQNILYYFDGANELPNKVTCKAFLSFKSSKLPIYMKERPLMVFLSAWRRFLPIYKIINNYQQKDNKLQDDTTYLYNGFFSSKKKLEGEKRTIQKKIT